MVANSEKGEGNKMNAPRILEYNKGIEANFMKKKIIWLISPHADLLLVSIAHTRTLNIFSLIDNAFRLSYLFLASIPAMVYLKR